LRQFAFVIHVSLRRTSWQQSIFMAALAYLIICHILRAILLRDHNRGMKACRAKRFEEAITSFKASRQFFLVHRRLDAFRSLVFGAAGPNPHRVIALCNAAFCYAQIGRGDKAIEFFRAGSEGVARMRFSRNFNESA
jgi:hypothetical protein